MNKLIAIAIVLVGLIFAASASAQTAWFETQVSASKVEGQYKLSPIVAGNASKRLGSGFGAFTFALATDGFAQLYGGPTYAPTKHLELGLGGGLSNNGEFRKGGYAWFGGSSGYLLALGEHDHLSGWWYRSIAAAKPTDTLAVGGHVQRYIGVGPYVELKLETGVLPITIWAAPIAYDWEASQGSQAKSLAGLRAHF